MKFIFSLSLLLFISHITFAQKLTKEEKAVQKEWEKRKKSMTAEEFKALTEKKTKLDESLKQAEAASLESEQALAQKTSELVALRNKATELEKSKEAAKEQQSIAQVSPEDAKGTFYKVQIFSCDGNPDEETARKYTLGRFNTLGEAQRFLKSLQKMQINNAKVVTYKNGKATINP